MIVLSASIVIPMISYGDLMGDSPKNGDFTMGIWDVNMGIEAYSNNNMGRKDMVKWFCGIQPMPLHMGYTMVAGEIYDTIPTIMSNVTFPNLPPAQGYASPSTGVASDWP